MWKVFAVIFALTLTACATTPTPTSDIKYTPSTRLLSHQNKSTESTGTIIVTRDTGYIGSGCYYALSINGVLAARFDVSERAVFTVEPGDILLKVGRDPIGKSLCSMGQDEWTQRESTILTRQSKASLMPHTGLILN